MGRSSNRRTHSRGAAIQNSPASGVRDQRKIVNTAIGRDVVSALEHFDVPVLPCHLCQRVLYAESAAEGLSLAEVAPQSEATREIAALVSWLTRNQDRRKAA